MDLLDAQGTTLPPLNGLPAGVRALVVEDPGDPDHSTRLLRPGLHSLGLEVFFAPSTNRAERVLHRVPIHLIILTLSSPRDHSKLEWFASIRRCQPDLLLIVIVDEPDAELERRCDAVGATAFLQSPVSLRTLRRCIERAFDGHRRAQEIERLKRRLVAAESAAACRTASRIDEAAHLVDELWFAIFEQLLSRSRSGCAAW